MGKINSREKGRKGEVEASHVLNDLLGTDCRRGQQHAGGVDSPDVVGLKGIHLEIKRVERLNIDDAMAQSVRDSEGSEDIPVVMHRKNRKQWLVTMRLTDWAEMYKEWRNGRI